MLVSHVCILLCTCVMGRRLDLHECTLSQSETYTATGDMWCTHVSGCDSNFISAADYANMHMPVIHD